MSYRLALADLELALSMLDSANLNNQIDYAVYAEVHDVISLAMGYIEADMDAVR
jgi:hypothetical protein